MVDFTLFVLEPVALWQPSISCGYGMIEGIDATLLAFLAFPMANQPLVIGTTPMYPFRAHGLHFHFVSPYKQMRQRSSANHHILIISCVEKPLL